MDNESSNGSDESNDSPFDVEYIRTPGERIYDLIGTTVFPTDQPGRFFKLKKPKGQFPTWKFFRVQLTPAHALFFTQDKLFFGGKTLQIAYEQGKMPKNLVVSANHIFIFHHRFHIHRLMLSAYTGIHYNEFSKIYFTAFPDQLYFTIHEKFSLKERIRIVIADQLDGSVKSVKYFDDLQEANDYKQKNIGVGTIIHQTAREKLILFKEDITNRIFMFRKRVQVIKTLGIDARRLRACLDHKKHFEGTKEYPLTGRLFYEEEENYRWFPLKIKNENDEIIEKPGWYIAQSGAIKKPSGKINTTNRITIDKIHYRVKNLLNFSFLVY